MVKAIADHPDRRRPVALLPVQHLEHRRRRPARRSARSPARSCRSSCPTGRTSLMLPLMLLMGILGGMALRRDPGAPQDPLRRQRDPDQPDAGLRRAALSSTGWCAALAQSRRATTFPDSRAFDRRPGAAGHLRRAASTSSVVFALIVVAGGLVPAPPHDHRLRDHRPRPGAAGRRLRRLQPAAG